MGNPRNSIVCLLIIHISFSFINAQISNLSGTVLDLDQNPVSGCRVYLSKPGNPEVISSQTGGFLISKTSINNFPIQKKLNSAFIKNHVIHFSIKQDFQNVNIEIRDFQGANLNLLLNKKFGSGNYNFDLSSFLKTKSVNSIYLVTLSLGSEFYTFKWVGLENASLGRFGPSIITSGNSLQKKATASLDTINIECNGVSLKTIGIDDYHQNLGNITVLKGKPNFILILTDDQGYNDIGVFGSQKIRTPMLDSMASVGMKFTSFYAQPVCGPSRAALMTGTYPNRIAERANAKNQHTIVHAGEVTIAEVLKDAGYATGMLGKWHLAGSGGEAMTTTTAKNPGMMPTGQGFDSYFGIPYSNDMNPSVLVQNLNVIETPVIQPGLTTRYLDSAKTFITSNKDQPFFLYLAHNMPHTPLYPSAAFEGNSPYGLYGDAIEEIDWTTGEILKTLKALGIDKKTMVLYMSDNGPWLEPPNRTPDLTTSRLQSGTALPLRGAKMTSWEGGARVPCIMHWPGVMPAGITSDEIVSTMDLLPTFAQLAGIDSLDPVRTKIFNNVWPQGGTGDFSIDGMDVSELFTGESSISPRQIFVTYNYRRLTALRSGKWKIVPARPSNPTGTGWSGRLIEEVAETQLFDLDNDIAEENDVSQQNPTVVNQLMLLVDKARAEMGDHDITPGTTWRRFD